MVLGKSVQHHHAEGDSDSVNVHLLFGRDALEGDRHFVTILAIMIRASLGNGKCDLTFTNPPE